MESKKQRPVFGAKADAQRATGIQSSPTRDVSASGGRTDGARNSPKEAGKTSNVRRLRGHRNETSTGEGSHGALPVEKNISTK